MARILFSTTPISGHVGLLFLVVKEMVQRGHTVGWYTSEVFREKIERIGATLFPIKEAFDAANRTKEEASPHLQDLTGIQSLIGDLLTIFINPAPRMLIDLEKIHAEFKADILVSDETSFACGFLKEKTGLPHVVISISVYCYESKDTAPIGTGILPLPGPIGRARNALLRFVGNRFLMLPVRKGADQARRRVGLDPIPGGVLENVIPKPELYLLSTVPTFEYPRHDLFEGTRFIGPLVNTLNGNTFTPPRWWHELDGERPVVHVTQGTISNVASDLLLPAIQGLAKEDMLIVVTTGNDNIDTIPLSQTAPNARLETFIPYSQLMPHVDALITNGGYGGVQQALTHGVPMVVAGATEEKMDIAAHIQWSGTGINLRTNKPKPDQIRKAVKRVLHNPRYRAQAKNIQAQYAQYNAPKLAADHIEALLQARGIKPPTTEASV